METIYNLFAICENKKIEKVAIASHEVSMSDEEMEIYLKGSAENDLKTAEYYPVSDKVRTYDADMDEESIGLNLTGYEMFRKGGGLIALFENALTAVNAPEIPFVIYSLVVDGKIIETHD